MKYRTFRNLATIGGIVIIMGLCGLCGSCYYFANFANKNSPSRNDNQVARTTPTPAQSPTSTPSNTTGLSRANQLTIDYLNSHASATTDKIKDAFPRESFKVNIYRDGSSPTWTRLKIDLDRDEKDDEKWTLNAGQPDKRQVSTRDDEQYDREYRWQGGKWVEKIK